MQIKTVDGDREVASKGVAGTALGLGIAGTVGLLNQWANGGGFGFGNGLFGFGRNNGWGGFGFDGLGVTNAVANMDTRTIGCLESKISKLESERYTDNVGIELYREIVAKTNANDAKIQSNYNELAKFVAQLDKQIAVDKKETECNFAFLNNRIDTSNRALANDINCQIAGLRSYVDSTFVPGVLKMPLSSLCPEAMRRYNSWVAPTTDAPDTVTTLTSLQEAQKK